MTPAEAVALLELHRETWPEWMTGTRTSAGCQHKTFAVEFGGGYVVLGLEKPHGRRVRVRRSLPDEENVRRILATAQKSYDQRRRQLDKARERKPMKRGPGLERKMKLKTTNRKRKAQRFESDFGGKDRVMWGQARPCDTCGAPPPSQNSHVITRGSRLGKAREMISQCDDCHRIIGKMPWQHLERLARTVYQEWLAQGGHELPSGLEEHGEKR